MNFVVGDTVTPLPELLGISEPAKKLLEHHRAYTIILTGRDVHPWFVVEGCHIRWIDSPDWWKLASKSNGFTLDAIT